jgi:predicted ribosome quality control (RQC) complex YloA/Tae2 family protein
MFEFYLNNNLVRVGSNASENWDLIDTIKKNDIWVHLKDKPSCHAVIRIPKKSRDERSLQNMLNYTGRMICTKSSKHIPENSKKVEFTYTKGKYVKKGSKVGEAILLKTPETFVMENPN